MNSVMDSREAHLLRMRSAGWRAAQSGIRPDNAPTILSTEEAAHWREGYNACLEDMARHDGWRN